VTDPKKNIQRFGASSLAALPAAPQLALNVPLAIGAEIGQRRKTINWAWDPMRDCDQSQSAERWKPKPSEQRSGRNWLLAQAYGRKASADSSEGREIGISIAEADRLSSSPPRFVGAMARLRAAE
jgi:hypothetical protein